MQITRMNYSPLATLQRSMDRWFDQALARAWRDDEVDSVSTFTPPVDIRETADNVEFVVELPGFEKEQIDVRVEAGHLILSGERKWEENVKDETYHRVERIYGRFQRTFSLPTSVETGKIKANLKNGVLHVVLPKSERARPQQIPVNVN